MMNDSWHIPRVSLATSADSSSNNSHKSNSNPPTFSKRSQNLKQINDTKLNIGMLAPDIRGFSSNHSGSSTHSHYHNTNYDNKNTIDDVHVDHRGQRDIRATYNSDNSNLNNPSKRSASTKKHKSSITVAKSASKRGSRTSLGSTDSNNSTKSASSGSLLLTAANLERFAEIHKIQNKMYLENIADAESLHQTSSHYNNNLTHMVECNNKVVVDDAIGRDFVITLDENLDFSKAKDGDTVSMASSMHFTMVNGEGGQSKKTKPGLCDRGRQVSVLIISMSLVFLLLILGMVYVLEMRAREMLQS